MIRKLLLALLILLAPLPALAVNPDEILALPGASLRPRPSHLL